MARFVRWTVTVHAAHCEGGELDDVIFRKMRDYTKCYVYQEEECPETGRRHLQGYFELMVRKTLAWVKANFGNAHYVAAKGTKWQNYQYCTKEESHVEGGMRGEMGDFIEPRAEQRRKSKLPDLVKELEDGKSLEQVAIEYPVEFLRHCNGIRQLANIYDSKRFEPVRKMRFIILEGPSGCGKSYFARSWLTWNYGHLGWHQILTPKGASSVHWTDGAQGKRAILIEEMDKDQFNFREFLKWTDVYTHQTQIKGGSMMAKWEAVIVTTNKPMNCWFPDEADLTPLERRVTERLCWETLKDGHPGAQYIGDILNFKEYNPESRTAQAFEVRQDV